MHEPGLHRWKRCVVGQVLNDGLCRKTARDDGLTDAAAIAWHPASSIADSKRGSVHHLFYRPSHRNPASTKGDDFEVEVGAKAFQMPFQIAFEFPSTNPSPTLAKFGPFGMIHA